MNNPKLSRRAVLAGAGAATAGAVLARQGAAAAIAAPSISPLARPSAPIPVAFLLDEKATMIDFTGPWEVLQDAGVAEVPGFELFTVAPSADPLHASGGMKIIPDYTLDNAPPAKVIVIPAEEGGRTPKPGDRKVDWLRSRYASADIVMSVCTGAFLLARTGLLDGLTATTHHWFYEDFEKQFPKIKLLKGQRFVDHGKLITTGGLSSGIEGALHVVERYYGGEARTKVANYMEYVSHTWTEA